MDSKLLFDAISAITAQRFINYNKLRDKWIKFYGNESGFHEWYMSLEVQSC